MGLTEDMEKQWLIIAQMLGFYQKDERFDEKLIYEFPVTVGKMHY